MDSYGESPIDEVSVNDIYVSLYDLMSLLPNYCRKN